MKRFAKKIVSLLLVAAMVFGAVLPSGLLGLELADFHTKVSAAIYSKGDIIEFGSYPQILITDQNLIDELNSLSLDWKSYDYYSGDDNEFSSEKGNWMKYADVFLDNFKYRAVIFSQYRPHTSFLSSKKEFSWQDNNKYYPNIIYWFKYEPLKWIVLDPKSGLVLSEKAIDSQAINNSVQIINGEYYTGSSYSNDYYYCELSDWLNNDFLDTAFTNYQKSCIYQTTIDNSAYSPQYSKYDGSTSREYCFLLSYFDVLNSDYGFDSTASVKQSFRRAVGTDYALCQGYWVMSSTKSGDWLLRSPGSSSSSVCVVGCYGNAQYDYYDVRNTGGGVRPALTIDFSKLNKYHIAGRSFDKNIDYYTEYLDSSNYSTELANMTAALSTAVYSENEIESAYASLGFSEYFGRYDYSGAYEPLHCGYALSFKKSDYSNDFICLVSVRGSNNKSDWHGNFIIETDEEGKHLGFEGPAYHIYENIKKQLEINKITGNIKYVITGHSRGAAVANLLSVKLMDRGVSSTNVYNYNFACPDVACRYVFPSYNNIFNLCNRADIVPHIPGSIASSLTTPGTSWGKFGKTYWFTKDVSNINSSSTVNDIKEGLIANHDYELYLEHFNQKLNPSDWSTSSADKKFDNYYKLLGFVTKVFCPVDVIVTDKYGNEMASVIGGEINYYNDCCGAVIILTDGDRKIIYINDNKKFNINLVGTDTGEMIYAVEEFDLLTEEVVESKIFTNVALEEGKTMYSPVSSADTTEDVELLLLNNDSNDNRITHTIETDGTENKIFLSVNVPKTRTIYLGDSIGLFVNSNLPNDYKIKWKVDGDGVEIRPSHDGKSCKITSTSTGNVVIKAYIVDSNGNIVTDENGKQISDGEYFYSEANLWLRIVYFFKKLFGISMTTARLFKGAI